MALVKRKPKAITVDNYCQFLPSEFVRSFASDVEVGEAIHRDTGKPMDMSCFAQTEYCLPCLGGMACLNLGIPIEFGLEDGTIQKTVAMLGDSIRWGTINLHYLTKLYPKRDFSNVKLPTNSVAFSGRMSPDDYQSLKRYIHRVADALEGAGH